MVNGTSGVRHPRKRLAELPPDQTFAVHKAVKALQKALDDDTADTAAIKVRSEDLTRVTATIADDVISSAVTKALGEQSSQQEESR